MKAVQCREFAGHEKLAIADLPDPKPGPEEVIVHVKAAGVNFPDLLMVAGKYQVRPPLPFVPGFEAAGVVDGTGDRVMTLVRWGAWAGRIPVSARSVYRLPASIPFESAATLPLAYGTAVHALRQRGALQAGETLLVLGASGGVGLAAVQIGKAMGARVIAAAGSPEKLELARQNGADELVDYSAGNLKDRLKELTGECGVDVILDPVGGEITEQAFRALGWNGRLLVVGFAGGTIPKLPLNLPLLKVASAVGVNHTQFLTKFPDEARANYAKILEWCEAGTIKPFVSRTYPMDRVVDALRSLENRTATGKIVLVP